MKLQNLNLKLQAAPSRNQKASFPPLALSSQECLIKSFISKAAISYTLHILTVSQDTKNVKQWTSEKKQVVWRSIIHFVCFTKETTSESESSYQLRYLYVHNISKE